MTDAYGILRFLTIFSASLLLTLVHSAQCHPTICCKDKEVKWRLLNVNHSLVILILLLFFMLLVDLCKGLTSIWLWGRMCDPSVKESFLTAIPQSSHRNIQPCIVSSADFSFKIIFVDWQKCGFCRNTSTHLSHYLCLRVSHWVVPHWSVTTQFTYEAVVHRVCLSKSIVGGYAVHLPSIYNADGIHDFFFV